MMEEWKWVKGFEGRYQISNHGKVRSFLSGEEAGRELSVKNGQGGYLSLGLIDKCGNRHTRRIHRLVAEAFIAPLIQGYEVHHIDGNKQNNHVTNLMLLSKKEHYKETKKQLPQIVTGMNFYNMYKKPKRIFQYTLAGVLVGEYANAKIASVVSGVCQRNILQVASKTPFNKKGAVRKQAGGYIWTFSCESEVMKCEV